MAKVDLCSAYRSVRIHPSNYGATGPKWTFSGDEEIIIENVKMFLHNMQYNIKLVTVDFAGVKFKTKASSGLQYLKQREKGILNQKKTKTVVCEENTCLHLMT